MQANVRTEGIFDWKTVNFATKFITSIRIACYFSQKWTLKALKVSALLIGYLKIEDLTRRTWI